MAAVHLLIETGRASRLAACDEPFANGQPGTETYAEVTCPSCLTLFPDGGQCTPEEPCADGWSSGFTTCGDIAPLTCEGCGRPATAEETDDVLEQRYSDSLPDMTGYAEN